jgi:phage terminase small subunit
MSDTILTPQQEAFLSYYTNPKSETFGNARQSALKANYSENYADNITNVMPEWLLENVGSMKRLRRAEKNLDEVQELSITNEEGKIITDALRERTKVDMFIAERIGKSIYSTKGEDATDKLADTLKTIVINKQYGSDNKLTT